jgi:hypothetical protein
MALNRLRIAQLVSLFLLLSLSACGNLLPSALTLIPTAAPPGMQSNAFGVAQAFFPPTWTVTPDGPPPIEQAATSAATMAPYERTSTPPVVIPTWTPSCTPTPTPTLRPTATSTPKPSPLPEEVWALSDYPRPRNDNGWGMHWFPTYQQDVDVINRFVVELQRMHIRWLVFLNDGTDIGRNDYLVRRLASAGIMPVMRFYIHGVVPYDDNLGVAVRHYRQLGVQYFQLYNEPNLYAEAAGLVPNPDYYVSQWIEAAQQVVDNGGLPGFGALSPGGEYDDLTFLRGSLEALQRRHRLDLLNRGWIAIHNYAQYQPVDSTAGYLRFRLYNQIVVEQLGRSLPILSTEGGHYADMREQYAHVTGEYRYLALREDYFFCHTYWLLGNGVGGSWDQTFEYQALFHADGYIDPLVTGFFYRGP